MPTRFTHTQIQVDDLDAITHFFSSVFGLRESQRFKVDFGVPVEEVILVGDESPTLYLLKLLDGTPTVQGESVLGFSTDEFDAVFERALAHGATVVTEPFRPPGSDDVAGTGRFAMLTDPEGHHCQIIEIIEQAG